MSRGHALRGVADCLLGALGAFALAGCTRSAAPPTATPASSTAVIAVNAAPSAIPAAPGQASRLVLVNRAVVDVAHRVVARILTNDLIAAGALDGSTAYLCVGYWKTPPQDSMSHELRAYDLTDGMQRWARPVDSCQRIVAGPAGVLVGTYTGGPPGATWHDRGGGSPRRIAAGLPVTAVQRWGDDFLAMHEDGTLDDLDARSLTVRTTTKLPFAPWPLFPGGAAFVDRGAEICAVDVNGLSLDARCLDAAGRARFTAHEPLGGSRAILRERGSRWVVAATTQGAPRSLVLDLGSGAVVARVDAGVAATVRDEAGDLDSLLVTAPTTQLLDRDGKVRWTSPERLQEGASALTKDGLVFVTSYMPMATGASLLAFDRTTGAVRWRGDLQLLPIDHSIYSNHVDLDFDHGALSLRGSESGQEYLELFAPADGTPLLRVVQKR